MSRTIREDERGSSGRLVRNNPGVRVMVVLSQMVVDLLVIGTIGSVPWAYKLLRVLHGLRPDKNYSLQTEIIKYAGSIFCQLHYVTLNWIFIKILISLHLKPFLGQSFSLW